VRSGDAFDRLVVRDFFFEETVDAAVVEQYCVLSGCRLRQMDRKTRIVELAVVIKDTAAKPFRIERRGHLEGLRHEPDIPLLEVADAAVDQLGSAGGSTFGEIVLFEQDRAEAAGCCVYGDAEAGGAASYNADVVGLAAGGGQLFLHSVPVHAIAAFTARCQPSRRGCVLAASICGRKRRSSAHCLRMSPTDDQYPVPRPAR